MNRAKPDEEVIFKAARRLPRRQSRDGYLAEACGGMKRCDGGCRISCGWTRRINPAIPIGAASARRRRS
jgi:hypothetical protein